ncbi:MAG: bifunctional 2-polyprenyl-6-hydroxyphenol methylase/3-demethylubiquinol 3-O-methyltransferase UbiG [Betaproteobacteria bacterium]|nr:bifunctional 2-polyprenyl-6-hydroxyphenol methylase/3-demethylubiquinol 3-O-methyltransferase UbiG [Betaproteobacteria bacterium]NBY14508.1 bifunctional 2-polyprenyl-6-hydroxyphenol methylase/3-demethylubiquinol 3-O-methyltransferase UbiG [Betaproteobacteria bacterium]NCA15606.1 bifunctional 2-polyprenyl-6-hydroxyphenol methylase/3-demethylubiquinol 3-O-methyltransferase UbiG [Betaproteobacteria bacterium]
MRQPATSHRLKWILCSDSKTPWTPSEFSIRTRCFGYHRSVPKDASSNADPAELEKFSALASRWWDPTSEFKPLHQINPLRLGWIDGLHPLSGQDVLDVGCGGGILSEAMARKGARVKGIDLAEKSIRVAQLHSLDSGVAVEYDIVSTEDLASREPGHYDIVTCMEMLEHVPDPSAVVRACAALTKPGGTVVFSTINRNPKSFLFAIVGAEYVLRLLPKGTHEYAKFIKPSELGRFAREAGLELVRLVGMTYNPLLKLYSLSKDTDVNYIMAFAKPR